MWEEIWGKLLLQWNVLLFIKTKSFIKIMCKTVLRFEVFQLLMFCNFVPSILWPGTVWISTQTSDTLENNEWCLTCGRWKKKKDLCFWYFVGFTFFFKQVQVCCTSNHTQQWCHSAPTHPEVHFDIIVALLKTILSVVITQVLIHYLESRWFYNSKRSW